MATPSNKPRDIKNLKARLGRTITPGQAGAPGAFPGAPGSAPGSVPPPLVQGGGFPGVPVRGSAPSGGVGQPLGQPGGFPGAGGPAFGRPLPAPGASVRSPLGGPAVSSGQPAPRASAPAGASTGASTGAPRVDPFAASAAPATGNKRVTLVIDDSAVKEDEIGRKSRGRTMFLALTCIALGLAAGYGVGNTRDQRQQYKAAVRDGKDIYARIGEVGKTVDSARELVKKAVEASTGGPGKKATVDFDSIGQLVAMKRPFSANEFSRRLYRAFGDNVVDDLFDYYNNINLMWDGFTSLGAKTAGPAHHEALTKSAAAADSLLNTDYGMVLAKNGDQLAGSIVFLNIPPKAAAPEEKPEKKGKKKGGKGAKDADEGIKVKVSSSQGGQEVERTLYNGQDGLSESFEKFAFIIDKVRSRTILGETANVFAKYRADLMEISARMDKTNEVQGRLIKELGTVAAMSE